MPDFLSFVDIGLALGRARVDIKPGFKITDTGLDFLAKTAVGDVEEGVLKRGQEWVMLGHWCSFVSLFLPFICLVCPFMCSTFDMRAVNSAPRSQRQNT